MEETSDAIEAIIDNYSASMDFYSNYEVKKTKSGKLETKTREKSKTQTDQSETRDESREID